MEELPVFDRWVSEPLLLVKGGASLELRRGIQGSRTSKDLDTVVRGDMLAVHDRLADSGLIGVSCLAAGADNILLT
jgi:hypothetical protein